MCKNSSFSTFSLGFILHPSDNSAFDGNEVISSCKFDLHFPGGLQCRPHVLFQFCILIPEITSWAFISNQVVIRSAVPYKNNSQKPICLIQVGKCRIHFITANLPWIFKLNCNYNLEKCLHVSCKVPC